VDRRRGGRGGRRGGAGAGGAARMRVTVRLFARLRDIAGTSELAADVPPGATIADVWAGLVDRHPALAPYAGSMSAARNLEYTRLSAAVAEADEIAFMPPVSGG
jgi:molybdopterin converting factor small subunit